MQFTSSDSSDAVAWTSKREVFHKTLAFYTTLISFGCAFQSEFEDDTDSDGSESGETLIDDSNSKPQVFCKGQLIFKENSYGQPFIQ